MRGLCVGAAAMFVGVHVGALWWMVHAHVASVLLSTGALSQPWTLFGAALFLTSRLSLLLVPGLLLAAIPGKTRTVATR